MHEALELMNEVKSGATDGLLTEVIIAPPAPYLSTLAKEAGPVLQLASQQCSATGSGAFTGEFTADMLASCEVKWVIIGHSERRDGYGETDDAVRNKLHAALEAGLRVLLCCGESLGVRESGTHFDWVQGQLSHAFGGPFSNCHGCGGHRVRTHLGHRNRQNRNGGTGPRNACFIRNWLTGRFDATTAQNCRILYGGSCKPSNADELFAQPDVNGGLIGGASLNVSDFLAIVAAAEKH